MNANLIRSGFWLCMLASAGVTAASDCTPTIEQAWVRAAPTGAKVMAGYATVRNPCAKPAVIIGVESMDFGAAMIHQTVVENGVSKMRGAGRLVVPEKGGMQLAPGGRHLMLMRPLKALPEGSRARIRLLLADGRKLFAEYPVQREAPVAAACVVMANAVSASARPVDRRLVNKLAARASLRDAVVAFGPAARDVGSGLHVLEWDVSRSEVLRISAPDFCSPSMAQDIVNR